MRSVMLHRLVIENFALIEHLDLPLESGFIAMTGETGSGKSILMQAVACLRGQRTGAQWVRTGSSEATVAGHFRPAPSAALKELGLSVGVTGDEWMVRRVFRKGRNRSYINGKAVSLRQLCRVVSHLVEVTGQHAQVGLQSSRQQMDFLDRFGNLQPLREQTERLFQNIEVLQAEKRRLAFTDRDLRMEALKQGIDEIHQISPSPGEQDKLQSERNELKNIDVLKRMMLQVEALLGSGAPSVTELLGLAERAFRTAHHWDEASASALKRVDALCAEVEDLVRSLQVRLHRLEADPARLDAVEERLAGLKRLQRRYGPSEEAVWEAAEAMAVELETLEGATHRLRTLEVEVAERTDELARACQQLSQRRVEAAQTLAGMLEARLEGLSMKKTRFQAALVPLSSPGPTGQERVEFLVAPNVGEAMMPLSQCASGGELARLLLALKSVLSVGKRDLSTQVFDEVDTGVGGRVAETLARTLKGMGQHQQILCVTHLPVVAAFADHHYEVKKSEHAGRTVLDVVRLDRAGIVRELSRMLGGSTPATERLAGELMAHRVESEGPRRARGPKGSRAEAG